MQTKMTAILLAAILGFSGLSAASEHVYEDMVISEGDDYDYLTIHDGEDGTTATPAAIAAAAASRQESSSVASAAVSSRAVSNFIASSSSGLSLPSTLRSFRSWIISAWPSLLAMAATRPRISGWSR